MSAPQDHLQEEDSARRVLQDCNTNNDQRFNVVRGNCAGRETILHTQGNLDRETRAARARERSEMPIYIPSVCDCDSRAPLHKTTTASRRAAAWLECREHNLRSTHTATLAPTPAPPLSMAALSALQESQVCTRWRLQAEPSWPAPRLAARAGALSLRASARAGSSPPPCKGRASPP